MLLNIAFYGLNLQKPKHTNGTYKLIQKNIIISEEKAYHVKDK